MSSPSHPEETLAIDRPPAGPVPGETVVTQPLLCEQSTEPSRSEARGGPAAVPGYEIVGELGRGAMGVVYQARQLGLNRLVALKMILAGDQAGDPVRVRFRAEAEAVARLQHPNIVQIHEIGEHQGRPYFSLEYCPGGSLAHKLAGTPLPPQEAARLVEPLARAVQAAHEAGVIHRDLKPGNVLLTADGMPKVADFGLAKRLDVSAGQTASGVIVGTPSYMPPEQAGGKHASPVGPAADVYGLGAVLYDCLTGRPPFRAATPLETALQVIRDDPVPPSRFQPRLPRDLETICLKCLEKDPGRRYPSAQELADDLRRFQSGEAIQARPTPSWERALKWSKRHPAAAVLMLTLLGAAATLAVVVAVYTSRLRTALDRAQREQVRAESSLARANDAVDTYLSAVTEDPLLKERDLHDLRQRLLESAVPFYQQLIAEGPGDPRPQAAQARAHGKLAAIATETGQYAEGRKEYEQAVAAFQRLAREHPDVGDYRADLAAMHQNLAQLLKDTGHSDEARSAFETALALFEQLGREDPGDARYPLARAKVYIGLGVLEKDTAGHALAAESAYRRALDTLAPLAAGHADEAEYRVVHAGALDALGWLYFFRFGARGIMHSEPLLRQARDLLTGLSRQYPRVFEYKDRLASNEYALGMVCKARREYGPAEEAFRRAAAIEEEQAQTYPAIGRLKLNLALNYHALSDLDLMRGRQGDAEVRLNKALTSCVELTERYPTVPHYRSTLAGVQASLGDLLARRDPGSLAALEYYNQSIANLERVGAMQKESADVRSGLGQALAGRAGVLGHLGRHAEALKDWDRVVEVDTSILAGWNRLARARARARVGDHARAVREADEMVEAASAHGGFYAFRAASVHAAAARSVASDGAISQAERGRLAERYTARALALLRSAHEAGAIDTAGLKELRSGEAFASLRSRSDFQALLRKIEASAGKKS